MTSIIFLLNGFLKGFSVLRASEEITFVLLRQAFTENITRPNRAHRRPAYNFLNQATSTKHVITAHLTLNCLLNTVNAQSLTVFFLTLRIYFVNSIKRRASRSMVGLI